MEHAKHNPIKHNTFNRIKRSHFRCNAACWLVAATQYSMKHACRLTWKMISDKSVFHRTWNGHLWKFSVLLIFCLNACHRQMSSESRLYLNDQINVVLFSQETNRTALWMIQGHVFDDWETIKQNKIKYLVWMSVSNLSKLPFYSNTSILPKWDVWMSPSHCHFSLFSILSHSPPLIHSLVVERDFGNPIFSISDHLPVNIF